MSFGIVVLVILAGLIVYTYVGYPLLLLCMPQRRPCDKHLQRADQPTVSVVLAVRNGEKHIAEKLNNLLAQDYERMDIIVVDDGSTDATAAIVNAIPNEFTRLIVHGLHDGKELAQLNGLSKTHSEIIVFTDVAAQLPHDGISRIVDEFLDPLVGAVSTVDKSPGAYIQYEMMLRQLESNRAGLVGLSGSCFAVRRDVIINSWNLLCPSDFRVAWVCAERGLFAIQARVPCYYAAPQASFKRVFRTTVRGLQGIAIQKNCLLRWRFQLFHHKNLRWMSSFAFFALWFFWWPLLILPQFREFTKGQLAVIYGVVSYLAGVRYYKWESTKR